MAQSCSPTLATGKGTICWSQLGPGSSVPLPGGSVGTSSVGVDPATSSWGNMINGARLELAREPVVWWSLLAAFAFMFTLVLAANLFSDVVRDAFDPRLRQQR